MKFPIPESALTQHIAVLGMTGSGKTSTEKLLIEHVVAGGARVCVLDTLKSDWWGITSSASGKSAGLPFKILGGPRGHIPLHSSAGKAIGQLVGSGKLPLSIIDMADFEAGGVQRFFVDFAQSLWKNARGVVYLVIEEAHELAPKERAGFNQENMAIHWAKKLATGSRTKGIRLVVATQRVQALHNALLSSCGTLIAHRVTYGDDQEPIIKWLKRTKKDKAIEIADSLAALQDGEGWLCSGREQIYERISFPKFKTFDNTATPTGDQAEVDIKTAAVDQDELRAIIGDAVKEAIANDPAELKKRIRELERQVAAKPAASIDETEIRRREQDAWQDGCATGKRDALEHAATVMLTIGGDIAGMFQLAIAKTNIEASKVTGARPENPQRRVETHRPAEAPRERRTGSALAVPRSQRQIDGRASSDANLTAGEARILAALIQFPQGRTRSQLIVITGYAERSITTYLPQLMARGYAEATRGGPVVATDAGRAALPDAEPLPTGKALRDYWLANLPEGERRILDVLIAEGGNPITRAQLIAETNYAERSITTYLPKLAAKNLVVSGRGEVRASEDLF